MICRYECDIKIQDRFSREVTQTFKSIVEMPWGCKKPDELPQFNPDVAWRYQFDFCLHIERITLWFMQMIYTDRFLDKNCLALLRFVIHRMIMRGWLLPIKFRILSSCYAEIFKLTCGNGSGHLCLHAMICLTAETRGVSKPRDWMLQWK